jgi:hypothetical protein
MPKKTALVQTIKSYKATFYHFVDKKKCNFYLAQNVEFLIFSQKKLKIQLNSVLIENTLLLT